MLPVVFAGAPDEASPVPVYSYEEESVPGEWLLLGPFPNEPLPVDQQTGAVPRAGFERDYLEALGGEATARILPETRIRFFGPDGARMKAAAHIAETNSLGMIDLLGEYKDMGPTENQVAYAACVVRSSGARTVHALFGSDDRAKVWVNGVLVHRFADRDRIVNPDEDHFTIELEEGLNRVLVKVENGSWGWGFAFRLLKDEAWTAWSREQDLRGRINRVTGLELQAGGAWNSAILAPGGFPEPRWANPELMEAVYGEMDVEVRWFDRELNEVAEATTPGRYLAYYEARPPNGAVIRRALTYYVAPPEFAPWRLDLEAPLPHLGQSGIDLETWAAEAESIAGFGGRAMMGMLYDGPFGAILLAAMHDRQIEAAAGESPAPAWMDPIVRHQESHLQLRAKLLGWPEEGRLRLPKKTAVRPARVLAPGRPAEAGFDEGVAEGLDAFCKAWAVDTGIPFTLLLARRGVIVHHAAYGEWAGSPVDTETRFDIASLTKLVTGTLLAQFVDQDLIDLDASVGRYLPDFPLAGEKRVTVRQCMMHLVGTEGHGTFGGFNNPWFDNQVLHQLPFLSPGSRHIYNGLSMNLAGRCMEAVARKSFVRLMHEHLFEPLGMVNTTVFDSAYGMRTTAHDLARIGQMLLNQGAYGNWVFFGENAFRELLPVPVSEVQPDSHTLNAVYGLGTVWERGPANPGAARDTPRDRRSLLGWNTLSHPSATKSVLRVDFDNDLIIAMCRPAEGPRYNDHWIPILQTIAAHLEP